MTTGHPTTIRDCALVVFAYSFNGLWESSVLSLKSCRVSLQGRSAFAKCIVWKGRITDREKLVAYHPTSGAGSPLALFERCGTRIARRPRSTLAQPSRRLGLRETSCTLSRVCLRRFCVIPRPDCKFTCHSLHIGARTENVLVGVPLEARVARFGWGAASAQSWQVYISTELPARGQPVSGFFGA